MTAPIEPTTAPDPAQVAPPVPEQNVDSLPGWARDAITKANSEAANYRTQVAALKPKADQFAALEEASKTEAQRLQETAAAAQRDLAAAQADTIRYKAAATHQISAEHFDLLGTGTAEEVEARAVKLAALLKVAAVPPAVPPVGAPTTRPIETARPGASPVGELSEDEQVYQALFGAPK